MIRAVLVFPDGERREVSFPAMPLRCQRVRMDPDEDPLEIDKLHWVDGGAMGPSPPRGSTGVMVLHVWLAELVPFGDAGQDLCSPADDLPGS